MLALGGFDWIVPTAELGDWSKRLVLPELRPYEWGVIGLAVLGLLAVLIAQSRLIAILSLGIQGTALALIFRPDQNEGTGNRPGRKAARRSVSPAWR